MNQNATTRVLATLVVTSFCAVAEAQSTIPIRKLGPAEAVAAESIFVSASVKPLSTGGVIIASRRRVLLFDASLKLAKVAADSSSLTGGRALIAQFPIVAYLADTTLVVDRNASSLLVIDPRGKIVRAMAFPRANDAEEISGNVGSGSAYADPKGRLIYRGVFPRTDIGVPRSGVPLSVRDSFPIVRADFDSRTVDTLGYVRVPSGRDYRIETPSGSPPISTTIYKPFPIVDTWTALPDGGIAIVRGSDYHIDWVSADGKKTSTPKMPFDWLRIADDVKARVVDSVNAFETARAQRDSAQNAARRRQMPSLPIEKWEVVPASQLPDYYPPIRDSGIRADSDGNVWILPTTSLNAQNGLTFDVVNRRGEVVERVQLPPQCALGAPGSKGVVFLICDGFRLEKRQIQR